MMEKLLDIAGVGGTVVLVLLIALSVISIGIIVERWIYFRRRPLDAVRLSAEVLADLQSGDREAAIRRLGAMRAVEAAALRDALAWYDAGPEAFTEILNKGLTVRRKEFESGLVFLGTLGNNAPFVGLFGTVLGIIVAFRELSSAAASAAGGTGNMNNVMSGIAEALVSTAIGILVAVPAVVFFNVFQKRTVIIEDNVAALGNVVCAEMKRQIAQSGEARESSGGADRSDRGSAVAGTVRDGHAVIHAGHAGAGV